MPTLLDTPDLSGVDLTEFAAYPSMTQEALLAELGDLRIKSYRLLSQYELAKRVHIMYELYKRGWTMGDVGEYFGTTRERVRQMFNMYGLERRPARNDPNYKEKKLKFRLGQTVS